MWQQQQPINEASSVLSPSMSGGVFKKREASTQTSVPSFEAELSDSVLQVVPSPSLEDGWKTCEQGQIIVPDRKPFHLLLPAERPLDGPYRIPDGLLYNMPHHRMSPVHPTTDKPSEPGKRPSKLVKGPRKDEMVKRPSKPAKEPCKDSKPNKRHLDDDDERPSKHVKRHHKDNEQVKRPSKVVKGPHKDDEPIKRPSRQVKEARKGDEMVKRPSKSAKRHRDQDDVPASAAKRSKSLSPVPPSTPNGLDVGVKLNVKYKQRRTPRRHCR